MRITCWTLLGAVAIAGGIGRAQQVPGQSEVIRAESRLVLVDAVVTDKKGNPVTGLSAQDFQVWEDGKEQRLASCTFEGDLKTGSQRRHVLFLFDTRRTRATDQVRAHDAAVKYIDANVGPNRLMAVASFTTGLKMIQDFTFDARRLKQALDEVRVGNTEGATAAENSARPGTIGSAATAGSGSSYQARAMLLSLASLAKSLGALPGRKVVVMFTQGFTVGEDQAAYRNLVDTSNRTRVSIYPVDLGGGLGGMSGADLEYNGPQRGGSGGMLPGNDQTGGAATGGMAAPASPRVALGALAKETGGFVLTGNDVFEAVDQIGREQDQYYTLAYPAPGSVDGSCHALRVKVNRSGTVLRARSRYCNERSRDLLAGTPAAKRLESKLADATPGTAGSMRAPFFYSADNTPRVNLSLDIAAGVIGKEKGKTKTLDVLAVAYRPDGAVAARISDTLQIDSRKLDPKQGLHYESQFEMPPGEYTLKLAFSSGEEALGRLEAPLAIESYDGKGIAISGLALSSNVAPIPKQGLGTGLLEGNTPLLLPGMLVRPSGTNQFKQSESPLLYVEVYHPLLTAEKPPRVGVFMRIIDQKTGLEKQNSGLVEITGPGAARDGTKIAVGLKLPVKELGPGAYRLEVTGIDSLKNHSTTRTTDLVVE